MKKQKIFLIAMFLVSLMLMFPVASAFSFSELLPTGNVVAKANFNAGCTQKCLDTQCVGKWFASFCKNKNRGICQSRCVIGDEETEIVFGETQNAATFNKDEIQIATKADLRDLNTHEISSVIVEDMLEKGNNRYLTSLKDEGYYQDYGYDKDDLLANQIAIFEGDFGDISDNFRGQVGAGLAEGSKLDAIPALVYVVLVIVGGLDVGLIIVTDAKGDSDSDGIPNNKDNCRNNPDCDGDGKNDGNGKPTDQDKDGKKKCGEDGICGNDDDDPDDKDKKKIIHYFGDSLDDLKDYLGDLDYVVDVKGDIYVSESGSQFYTKVDKVHALNILKKANIAIPSY